jgi:hypothetical protein
MLHIKPTLQDLRLIESDSVIDLQSQGICSSTVWSNCITGTNVTNGTIVNPVKSGRINTRKGAKIRYGRIEVEAKLPDGDWLWPAIWLLPADAKYGPWPQSGEIDIVESRGNNHTYKQGGNNIVSSSDPSAEGYPNRFFLSGLKRPSLGSKFSQRCLVENQRQA